MTDMAKLQTQIEFYFSDSNYRKDTFLKAAADTDPEGFIPIAVLLTFNKMKSMNADVPKIVEAIQTSNIVHLNEDNTKIKKAIPLPEEDDSKSRTIYAKGYPKDDSEVTIEYISEEFSKFGKVNLVRFRRDDSKAFKGSCFIEFSNESEALDAIEKCNKDGKVNVSFKGTDLVCVMRLSEWLQKREDKRKAKKLKIQSGKPGNFSDNSTKAIDHPESKEEVPVFVPGLVIKVENVKDNLTYDEIKSKFGQYGLIRYVEYNAGETFTHLRFSDVENLSKISAAIDSDKLTDCQLSPDVKLKYSVLVGDDEMSYYQKLAVSVNNKKERGQSNRGGGRGSKRRFQGGRGRGSKRGRRD